MLKNVENKKRKVNSSYITKNKNLVKNMNNKAKEKSQAKDNLNKSALNHKKKNKEYKVTFSLDKSEQIDKNEIIDKMETGETIYKITNENSNEFSNRDSSNKKNKHKKYEDENDTRAIKPPILSRYSSSTSEEEEEDDEEEKEEEKEIEPAPQEEPKTKKPNRFDELLHAYGTNYVYEIKKINANNDNKSIPKKKEDKKISRNMVMKNTVNSKNIYTDKETDQIRRELKRKLTHNEYKNDDNDDYDSKNFQKIKTNKAKIKKFKTKNEYDEGSKMSLSKKDTGNVRPSGNKAKIKKMKNRNDTSDKQYNNIVLQNSTYNQTTYNYYTNDKPRKLISTHTISNKKLKNNSNERTNKSVGTRSRTNKNKIKSTLRY